MIRVLKVLPSSSDRVIHCSLQHMTLSKEHVCLSYTWGQGSANQKITINGRRLFIRDNLWDFLQRSRQDMTNLMLWIDAICIDQNNIAERNHQVNLMAEIYSSAKCVLLWMGPLSPKLKKMAQIVSKWPLPTESDDELGLQIRLAPDEEAILERGTDWLPAFQTMEQSAYWDRVWTLQERLLAKEARVVLEIGTVAWHDLIKARPHLDRIAWPRPLFQSSNCTPYAAVGRHGFQQRSLAYRREPIQHLLGKYSDLKCKDERDRIYGLMGWYHLKPR